MCMIRENKIKNVIVFNHIRWPTTPIVSNSNGVDLRYPFRYIYKRKGHAVRTLACLSIINESYTRHTGKRGCSGILERVLRILSWSIFRSLLVFINLFA